MKALMAEILTTKKGQWFHIAWQSLIFVGSARPTKGGSVLTIPQWNGCWQSSCCPCRGSSGTSLVIRLLAEWLVVLAGQ